MPVDQAYREDLINALQSYKNILKQISNGRKENIAQLKDAISKAHLSCLLHFNCSSILEDTNWYTGLGWIWPTGNSQLRDSLKSYINNQIAQDYDAKKGGNLNLQRHKEVLLKIIHDYEEAHISMSKERKKDFYDLQVIIQDLVHESNSDLKKALELRMDKMHTGWLFIQTGHSRLKNIIQKVNERNVPSPSNKIGSKPFWSIFSAFNSENHYDPSNEPLFQTALNALNQGTPLNKIVSSIPTQLLKTKMVETSLLHEAVRLKRVGSVSWLLEQGARVDCYDTYLNTPLHLAASYNLLQIAESLVAINCSVILNENKDGETPLDIAENLKFISLYKFLKTSIENAPSENIRQAYQRKYLVCEESQSDKINLQPMSLSQRSNTHH